MTSRKQMQQEDFERLTDVEKSARWHARMAAEHAEELRRLTYLAVGADEDTLPVVIAERWVREAYRLEKMCDRTRMTTEVTKWLASLESRSALDG